MRRFHLDRSADRDVSRDDPESEPTEEANYRETMRGVRSFMNWHKVPEFETVSSTADDNPFAGARVRPTGKVSVKLPVDDWLCRKMSSLNLTLTEGYPTRNTDNTGLLRDQFIKTPRSSRWYGMHAETDSESTTVRTWSPDPAKLNHSFSRVARRNFSQELLRRWERAAREQTIMCNQAAGLSRCLTRVQDSMATQLKTLHLDSKGKSSEKMKQAVSELEYLTTFNRSISQAMARTVQDLSEGIFINMANFKFKSYQFKALPFGLSTAPMEFTVVAKEVKLMALQKDIRTHQYLDDWLVRASTHDTCLLHTQTLVTLCQELGWLVDKEKSELVPKQVFNFVGYQFDLKEGKVRPAGERWQTLTDKIRSILSDPVCPVRKFMSLIGLLTATEKQVHFGRLHMRPIQWHLKNNWRVPESLENVIPVPKSLHPHLR